MPALQGLAGDHATGYGLTSAAAVCGVVAAVLGKGLLDILWALIVSGL